MEPKTNYMYLAAGIYNDGKKHSENETKTYNRSGAQAEIFQGIT